MADEIKKPIRKTATEAPAGLNIGSTAAAAPAAVAAPIEKPIAKPKAAKGGWWWGVGRRKRAVARVRIKPATGGEGKVTICLAGEKTKTVEQYFCEDRDRTTALSPLKATGTLGKLDVYVRVNGGGYMGQAGAIMMGLARCLKDFDPTTEPTLRDNSMLSRDAREVERKKYGQAGARRRFQFSKR
jgi:small subunit ribosomal protein S9